MQQHSLTSKQKEILLLLYQFRFLTTHHIQKLLNHKDPHRIKTWLKDLTDKEYIIRDYSTKSLLAKATPALYSLGKKSLAILKENDTCDPKVLRRVYSEKTRSKRFVDRCLMVADWYLFFSSKKKVDETIRFFTESMLTRFEYFPKPLPAGYLAVTSPKATRRYVLEIFDAYTPSSVMRHRLRYYLRYAEGGDWEVAGQGKAFPTILFVCPTERAKNHLIHYAKAIFEKSEKMLSLFVTTKATLHQEDKNVWGKVDIY
jgi:hypothetical protein